MGIYLINFCKIGFCPTLSVRPSNHPSKQSHKPQARSQSLCQISRGSSMAINTTNFSPPLQVHAASPSHTPTSSPSTRFPVSQNGPLNSQFRPPSPSFPFPSLSLKPSPSSYKPRSSTTVAAAALGKLSQTDAISVPSDLQQALGAFPSEAGVYAVFDGDGELQFIGISRNIAASIVGHRKSLRELCGSVKVGVVEEPDRITLTQAWKSWMEEHIKATGKIPPGNESGNITWTKQTPRKKPDLWLTPGRHVQLTIPLEELIDRLVKENKVVAFIKGSRSAPLCGFSQRVVSILESEGIDYESVDVLDEEYNSGLREALKKYSNWPTFPQIFVGGELVGGCDILTSMYEKGELASLLKKFQT